MSESPALGEGDAAEPGEGEAPSDGEPGNPLDAGAGDDSDGAVSGDAGGEDSCADDPLSCLEIPADCVGESFEGHAYLFCSAGQYWGAARDRCKALGLDLTIVETAEENAFLAAHLSGTSWIGAHDRETEGSFRWVEPGGSEAGPTLSFTKWSLAGADNCGGIFGEQDCVRLAASGSWDDSACDGGCLEDTFAFICESY